MSRLLYAIRDDKITDDLLSMRTAQSAAKCRFFLAAGYSSERWQELRDDLLRHPETAELEADEQDRFGIKRRFRCRLPMAPNRRTCCVRSVWLLSADNRFWLVTAYPQ